MLIMKLAVTAGLSNGTMGMMIGFMTKVDDAVGASELSIVLVPLQLYHDPSLYGSDLIFLHPSAEIGKQMVEPCPEHMFH